MENGSHLPGRFRPPAPQENVRVAVEHAVEMLRCQRAEQMAWLGAEPSGALWRLPVLNDVLLADPAGGQVNTPAGRQVGPAWQVLVLHYLAVAHRPEPRPPELTFADFPSGRGYAGVYQNRVIKRFCATAGRDLAAFRSAAALLGGRPAQGGDAAFDFQVFPRVGLRLLWHAPDEEFPPSATLLLPGNVEEFFCTEDIVVLCESCTARLAGKPF